MGWSSSSTEADTPQANNAEEMTTVINGLINDNEVMVFSKSYCPYCKKAKNKLKSLGKIDSRTKKINKELNICLLIALDRVDH